MINSKGFENDPWGTINGVIQQTIKQTPDYTSMNKLKKTKVDPQNNWYRIWLWQQCYEFGWFNVF